MGHQPEIKTISGTGPNTVKNAIQSGLKQGQLVIIDARAVPSVTKDYAVKQILRVEGNGLNLKGRVLVVTKSGVVAY